MFQASVLSGLKIRFAVSLAALVSLLPGLCHAEAPLPPTQQPFCLYRAVCNPEAHWPFFDDQKKHLASLVDDFQDVPTKVVLIATIRAKASRRGALIQTLNDISQNEGLTCAKTPVVFLESYLADASTESRYQFIYFKTYDYDATHPKGLRGVSKRPSKAYLENLLKTSGPAAREGEDTCEKIRDTLVKNLPRC